MIENTCYDRFPRSKAVMGEVSQSAVAEFQEDLRAPLIDPNTSNSTEFWLIQWPKDQIPDFDGQELSLDLRNDGGQLGTFQVPSGKSYDVVSLASQEPATVFLSSATDSKIVGKITRRVSFINYLEASEVPKDDIKKLKLFNERSSVTSLTNSAYNFATPAKSTRPGQLSGRTSTHTSGRKSSLSVEKTRTKESNPSRSTQDSDHASHSGEKKKKRKKDVA
ncbi:mediator-associated protein 2 [Tanacetum coccineum]